MVSEKVIDHKKQGKRNRAAGASFELKTKADLETQGWFVSKFQSNVSMTHKCEGKVIKKGSQYVCKKCGEIDFKEIIFG